MFLQEGVLPKMESKGEKKGTAGLQTETCASKLYELFIRLIPVVVAPSRAALGFGAVGSHVILAGASLHASLSLTHTEPFSNITIAVVSPIPQFSAGVPLLDQLS